MSISTLKIEASLEFDSPCTLSDKRKDCSLMNSYLVNSPKQDIETYCNED